jgi:hypothetical protein
MTIIAESHVAVQGLCTSRNFSVPANVQIFKDGLIPTDLSIYS